MAFCSRPDLLEHTELQCGYVIFVLLKNSDSKNLQYAAHVGI